MAKTTISIDPVTRIEGHLKAEVVVENGAVVDAKLEGGMYRGFETILRGRDPRDAAQIVQRICGVCPASHATAAVLAVEDASGAKITENARITRNLITGANYVQSHILHFYHLTAQDFVQGPNTAPFVPRFRDSDLRLNSAVNKVAVDQYIEALDVRRICHEMVAMFGGRMPHIQSHVVGGTTEIPSKEKLVEYAARFQKARAFVMEKYIPVVYTVGAEYKDLFDVAHGFKSAVAMGVFPMGDGSTLLKAGVYKDGKDFPFEPEKIKEYVKYSWFEDGTTGLHYSDGKTIPAPGKEGAYSFVKAPRYDGATLEVGPLARMWVTNPELSPVGQKMLKEKFGINAKNFRDIGEDLAFSLMGRHVARAEETYVLVNAIEGWLKEIKAGEETYTPVEIPSNCEGTGFTEAPRGALIHFIKIKDDVIDNYQIISASLWNCAPRDDNGQRGAIEEALIGVPVADIANPVNVARVIRAFDP